MSGTKYEDAVLFILTRIAVALEHGNKLAETAMEQRGKMDPSLEAMVKAAQELVSRPTAPGFGILLVRDSENGICPQTGESCLMDCGIGQQCRGAPFEKGRKAS